MSAISIERIRSDTAAILRSYPYFDDLGVVSEDEPDLEAALATALAGTEVAGGKIGAALLVLPDEADVESQNIPGPELSPLRIRVAAFEMIAVNRDTSAAGGGTGKTTFAICVMAMRRLHQFGNYGANCNCWLVSKAAIRPMARREMPEGMRGHLLTVEVKVELEVLEKVTNVTITVSASTATLACPGTSGTAIYYTLDGTTFPSEAEGASLYGAPFAVTAGQTIRAAAYKSGLAGSNINEHEVS